MKYILSKEELTNGYYWVHNLHPSTNKSIWRIIDVIVLTEPTYMDCVGMEMPSGTYYTMHGWENYRNIDEIFEHWKHYAFVKLGVPHPIGQIKIQCRGCKEIVILNPNSVCPNCGLDYNIMAYSLGLPPEIKE